MAAAALGEDRVLGVKLVARLERALAFAVRADAHVLRRDALHAAVVVVEDLRGREARKDVHAGVLGLFAQPAAEVAERQCEVAVVLRLLGHRPRGQQDAVGVVDEVVEEVVRHRHTERRALVSCVGHELVERLRGEDGAGEDVRTDLGALLDQADHEFGIGFASQLHQPARRCQPRRATADDHDVELHRLTGFFGHASPPHHDSRTVDYTCRWRPP